MLLYEAAIGKKQLQFSLPGSRPRFGPLRGTDEPVRTCSFACPNAGSPLTLITGADIHSYVSFPAALM